MNSRKLWMITCLLTIMSSTAFGLNVKRYIEAVDIANQSLVNAVANGSNLANNYQAVEPEQRNQLATRGTPIDYYRSKITITTVNGATVIMNLGPRVSHESPVRTILDIQLGNHSINARPAMRFFYSRVYGVLADNSSFRRIRPRFNAFDINKKQIIGILTTQLDQLLREPIVKLGKSEMSVRSQIKKRLNWSVDGSGKKQEFILGRKGLSLTPTDAALGKKYVMGSVIATTAFFTSTIFPTTMIFWYHLLGSPGIHYIELPIGSALASPMVIMLGALGGYLAHFRYLDSTHRFAPSVALARRRLIRSHVKWVKRKSQAIVNSCRAMLSSH